MSFNFQKELAQGLDSLGIAVSSDTKAALERYFVELSKWKKKVNLIAKSTGDAEIVEKHFVDCLGLVPHLQGSGTHLVDIGTGGGFPGLVCKAALPELQLTLIEPRLKRVSFLRHIVRSLGLDGVEIRAERLEDISEFGNSSFSHITCRAVTDIGTFLEMAQGVAQKGARLILMKGPKWEEELNSAQSLLETSSYSFLQATEYVLPYSGARRALLFFRS